jgi:ABC-type long-subunit fatty acid transport system fused permease/ATPase subunit
MRTVTRQEGTLMKRIVLAVIGALIALTGIIWTLQGFGYISGSFMTGATLWAVIGPVVALIGLVIVGLGFRGRRRAQ